MKRRIAAWLAVFSLLLVGLSVAQPAEPAAAADARDFNPGNIITDALFFDGNSMNAGQVQSFLNSQLSSCRSGYTCLKDYVQATPGRAAVAGRCAAYAGSGAESAASIIAKVGAACGISQKVLLVMLEKEQSLVGDTWPSARQYRSAMGYGCPDTADCDANYYGFFNQVYAAALQFQNYAGNPTRWNHIAGRVNAVRFNPNAACGSSQVFIQNQATAGLYNYTPYQPNASALANLYGTGDGCGAYGNRNFWRLYTDWFGSTTGPSNLLRTTDNATVYLISGTKKYQVNGQQMLTALAPLGQVGYVSQSYLDKYTTAQAVGRIMRAPNGTIYFFDAGIKLPFGSCTMVADYGGACADTGYVQLTDAQVATFVTGPAMTSVTGTREGGRYAIKSGGKREVLDARSQAEAGYGAGFNVLTEAGLSDLPLGNPIARDSVFATERGTSNTSLLSGGARYAADSSTSSALNLPAKVAGSLSSASLRKYSSPSAFIGVVRAGSGPSQILATNGRYEWTGDPGAAFLNAVTVSQEFVDVFPKLGSIGEGSFVKSSQNSSVGVIAGSSIRPVASWPALVALAGSANPAIVTVPPSVVSRFSTGGTILAPSSLVRSASNGTIYLIDGLTGKIPLSSFDPATEMGVTGYSTVSQASLDGYTTSNSVLGYGVTCGGRNYVAAAGQLHEVTAAMANRYPFTFLPLTDLSCAQLGIGTAAGSFIRTENGSIFLLENGQKRPVTSMARYAALGGTPDGYLSVSSAFAVLFTTGALA